MSRYLILLLFNLPFIVIGMVNSLVTYKLGRSSKGKLYARLIFWLVLLSGLILAEPIYEYLHVNGLTVTDSLSLFDVVQITGIIFLIYMTNRNRNKVEALEYRLKNLHQELSIQLSSEQPNK